MHEYAAQQKKHATTWYSLSGIKGLSFNLWYHSAKHQNRMRTFVVFAAILAVALAVPDSDFGESGEAEAEWAMAEGKTRGFNSSFTN